MVIIDLKNRGLLKLDPGRWSAFTADYRLHGRRGLYSSAAEILANEFTVLNYYRRRNSRSTGDRSIDMSVAQQARDAMAVIKAIGNDRAFVFRSSGGGIISLELAAAKPEVIDFLIVQVAPLIELLPAADADRGRSFLYEIYTKNLRNGINN